MGLYLYCGFVTSKDGDWVQCDLTEKEIKDLVGFDARVDGWRLFWEYLPVDDDSEDSTPNFKQANALYYDLFDEEGFDNFISSCMERINWLLKSIA